MRGGPVVAAVAASALVACSGPDPALVGELEATGLTLHAPSLRASAPVAIDVDDDTVRVHYDEDGSSLYVLEIAAAPEGDLCGVVDHEAGSDCEGDADTMVASFEEMTVVAVRRGASVLVARSLVTEVDPDLAQDAVAALREAPEASAEELAASVA